ncbi:MAG TPA: pyridoxal-dependent decarboxylase [Amnibacterium sp.]|nr:pyridoxal-dependent decarboxylase [Amnibacterium sp.]
MTTIDRPRAVPDRGAALAPAVAAAERWLASLDARRVPAAGTPEDAIARLGATLPDSPGDPASVVDRLAAAVEPGLMASGSGRFYGWVMGGALPAALGADWLVSAWDQNAGMRDSTPGVVAAEEIAAGWLLDLLGLPPTAAVGFTTGATMANLTGLGAARHRVLASAGWDDAADGLSGAPRIRVLAGAARHGSVDLALRLLGLGTAELVAADDQGRLDAADLRRRLADGSGGPTIVCLQAGDVHSGAMDPFADAIEAAHAVGAWVHVDGAFGLWAAADPRFAGMMRGLERADSWATDAHKTLNVPYDCGVAIVADEPALRAAMGVRAAYLLTAGTADPYDHVPELSRRARGVPVWAALASLGRSGVVDLVDGLHRAARGIAEGVLRIPGAQVLNDVVFTQVCVAFESDERTRAVFAELLREGAIMPSASVWRGRAVIRFSVSSWRTDAVEVAATVAAVERAAAAAR